MSVYYAYLDPNGLALAGKHIFADWDKLTKFYMAHGQKATVKKCNSLEEAEEFLGLPTELQAGKVCYAVAGGKHNGVFTCLEAAWAQVEYLPVNTAKGGIRRCANPEAAKKWLAQRGIKWEAPAQKSQVKPAAKPAKKNATKQPTKKATPETKQKKKSKQKVSTKSVVAGKKGKTHKTSPFAAVGEKDVAMVYTDGSFNDGTMIWGYSALIYDARDKKAQLVFSGSGVEYSDKKNITGEIMGAYRGIQEALKLGYKNIVVCHDFDGVAGYAKGSYSNGNELASWYHSEVGNLMAQAQISFKKIAAHSGNEYNTKADRCARIAAGVQV